MLAKFFRGLKSFLFNLELGPCPVRSETLLFDFAVHGFVLASYQWGLTFQPRVKLGAQTTSCLFADRSWEPLESTVSHPEIHYYVYRSEELPTPLGEKFQTLQKTPLAEKFKTVQQQEQLAYRLRWSLERITEMTDDERLFCCATDVTRSPQGSRRFEEPRPLHLLSVSCQDANGDVSKTHLENSDSAIVNVSSKLLDV